MQMLSQDPRQTVSEMWQAVSSYTTLSLLKYPKASYMALFYYYYYFYIYIYIYKNLLAQSVVRLKKKKEWKKEMVTVTFPVRDPLNGSDVAVKVF